MNPQDGGGAPPILRHKSYGEPSAFTPENLLREARRQKGLAEASVPSVCLLDPDGDIVRGLRASARAVRDEAWACYHTDLFRFEHGGRDYGIVGCAVGAPYAVLVAEQMFASGCGLLVSVTSAGRIDPGRKPPYFILIDKALRDEGTSHHYLPPAEYSAGDPALLDLAARALAGAGEPVVRGATWTTDAPFRETASAVEAMREKGVLAVEMEAAALYAFAAARRKPVLCVAHVTNQMAQVEGDFEKGEANGAVAALDLAHAVAAAWEAAHGKRRP